MKEHQACSSICNHKLAFTTTRGSSHYIAISSAVFVEYLCSINTDVNRTLTLVGRCIIISGPDTSYDIYEGRQDFIWQYQIQH